MNRKNLSKEIENIKNQIVRKYKPEKIILFGSASSENAHPEDIDLFIIKKNVPRLGDERIRELYKLVDGAVAVDYLVYKPEEVEERLSLGDPFIKKILSEGKVLYG